MPHDLHSILVPTDFSPPSVRALEYAALLAAPFDSSVHLLHVVEEPVNVVGAEGYVVDVVTLREQMVRDAEQRLEQDAASLGGVAVTTEIVLGHAAEAIARVAADRGADLIVMGTHGRSGVAHLLLGSVAEHVIRLAECPVLTVRQHRRTGQAGTTTETANARGV